MDRPLRKGADQEAAADQLVRGRYRANDFGEDFGGERPELLGGRIDLSQIAKAFFLGSDFLADPSDQKRVLAFR